MCVFSLRADAKKSLHDVYRCVFMLRRDVFTNRPLPPTSSGQVHIHTHTHTHTHTHCIVLNFGSAKFSWVTSA